VIGALSVGELDTRKRRV